LTCHKIDYVVGDHKPRKFSQSPISPKEHPKRILRIICCFTKKKKPNKKTQKKPTKKPHTQTNYPEMFSETEDKNCLLSL